MEILRAEMRRVLRSLAYEAEQWTRRADLGKDTLGKAEFCGRKAYAKRPAKDYVRIADGFKTLWLQDEPARGQKAGPKDGEVLADVRRLLEGDLAGDLEEEGGVHSTDMPQ